GQLDHEAVVYRPDHDRDLILLAATPANVAQEREGAEGELGGVAQNGIDEALDEGPYALVILTHLLAPLKNGPTGPADGYTATAPSMTSTSASARSYGVTVSSPAASRPCIA